MPLYLSTLIIPVKGRQRKQVYGLFYFAKTRIGHVRGSVCLKSRVKQLQPEVSGMQTRSTSVKCTAPCAVAQQCTKQQISRNRMRQPFKSLRSRSGQSGQYGRLRAFKLPSPGRHAAGAVSPAVSLSVSTD